MQGGGCFKSPSISIGICCYHNNMAVKTGIDKIALTTKDFGVKNLSSDYFGIDTSTKQGGAKPPYLLTDQAGKTVEAWKAYHNSARGIGNYTISDKGLLISFNPSKLFNPYQLISTTDKNYPGAFEMINQEMRQIGISCNLAEMRPCRIDIAAQNEMKFPLHHYADAFRLLKGSRMKNQREYEGGFLFGNTQNQTMFYDKQKELEYQNIGGILQGEKNLLRGEVRQLNAKSVGKLFNISTIADFNSLASSDIDNIYKTFLNKRIFSRQYISDQLQLDFDTELQILREYRKEKPRLAWKLYIMESNLDMILLKHGSIENFGLFLMEAGYERTAAHRIKNEIKKMLSKKANHDTRRGEITTATLLTELQDKFAA